MNFRLMTLFVALFIAGCAASTTPTPELEVTAEATESPHDVIDSICQVTDVGSIDDGTFNEYAYEGMISLADDFDDITTNYIETEEGDSYEANIEFCLETGADIIVTTGFIITEATLAAARANEQVYFIGVDQDVAAVEDAPENYVGIQAREDQAGFLVGVIAATVANELDADVIGGVYGIDVPAVVRFRNGYEQGALYVNPDWEVGVNILGRYTDSFTDQELGADIAQEYIDAGAVVIFGAGGLTGSGGIVRAASQGVYGIGVDQDEYFTTFQGGELENSEYLLTSSIKRVDRGVIDVATLLFSGRIAEFPGGSNYVLSVVNNGVGFAPMHDADIPQSVFDTANEVYGMMLRGELSTGVNPVTGELEATEEAETVDDTEATEESE